MPTGIKQNLTADQKTAIREMRDAHPRMTLRAIGAIFKVTPPCIHAVLNKPERAPLEIRQVPTYKPPSCTIQQAGSIIAPLTLSQLMGGRAPRARLASPPTELET